MENDGSGLRLKEWRDMPKGARMAIESVSEATSVNGTVTLKVKMASKLGALEQLARHLGMFIERRHVTGQLSVDHAHAVAQLSTDEIRRLLSHAPQEPLVLQEGDAGAPTSEEERVALDQAAIPPEAQESPDPQDATP